MAETVGKRLRELRLRAGASLEQAAEAMGLSRASSAQHYEDDYKKSYIPMDKVRGLAPLLVGQGMPPISEEEVYALAGHDAKLKDFVDHWLELKKKDKTIERLYDHWILGKTAVEKEPRWSVIRNVLHWID